MEESEIEVQSTSNHPETGLVLTAEAQYYLQETGKWANFLSIVGFIVCGIFLIMAFFIGTIFSFMGRLSPVYSQIPSGIGAFLSIFFILIDVLYFFFPFYLYQFASRIKKGLILSDKSEVALALSKLKSFFKLAAIVTIVVLCIYALEIIGFIFVMTGLHR